MAGGERRLTRRALVRLLGAGASAAALAACSQPTGGAPASKPAAGGAAPTAAPAAAQAAGSKPAGQGVTMKIGTATINDAQHEWAKRLKERLDKRMPGQINVEIYPASQLGNIQSMIQGVQLGTLECWMGPPDFLAGTDPRFMVPGAPLLFRNEDHAFRVLNDSQIEERFFRLGEDKGMKGIAIIVYGPNMLFSRTPIRTVDDVRGKKLRIFAAPTEIETMNAWSATGVPMTLGEVASALSSGAVDGAQSGMSVGDTLKFYDLVKYVTDTHHSMITSIGVISKSWFDRLPADTQRALLEEAKALQPELLEFQKNLSAESAQRWDQNTQGGYIRLSDAERQAFLDKLTGVNALVIQQRPEVREMMELFQSRARALA